MNRLDYRNLNQDHLFEIVERDGYCVVKNVLDMTMLRDIMHEVQPHLKEISGINPEDFLGNRTKRFGEIVHRIPSAHPVIQHPMVMDMCKRTVCRFGPAFQLSFTGIMHVMEGQESQRLHRDLTPLPAPSPALSLATMWALTDFKRENGATVVAPGSHKWDNEREPTREELIAVEMNAGSMFFYQTTLIHGAGRCRRGSRTGLNLQYNVGWMRQEENQYLAVPFKYARTLSKSMQRLIGYDLAARHWGSVGQSHPLDWLNQEKVVGTLQPDGMDWDGVLDLHAEARPGSDISWTVSLDD